MSRDTVKETESTTELTPLTRARVAPHKRKVTYRSYWLESKKISFDLQQMRESLRLACGWLIERCMCPTAAVEPEQNPYGYVYDDWTGAAREYNAREQRWHIFGPIWHTGQLVKALVLAHGVLDDDDLLTGARRAADFVMRARIADPTDEDFGAINSQENADPRISATSCMLESLDGLMLLGELPHGEAYWQAALDCLDWARRRLFLPEEGLFLDDFDVGARRARSAPNTLLHGVPGRPLIEDGVFLKGYQKSGDRRLRDVFYRVAERLLVEEYPEGNWVRFPPCDQLAGLMHPRQAFWWGRPMVLAWRDSGDDKYLQCAHRVARWYQQAQRLDGGMFRVTNLDFQTTSYGHATSGVLGAVCVWHDLIVQDQGDAYRESLRHALHFARAMQFIEAADENLRGGILEKVLMPDGSDRSPYMLRDLGAIFYVQALSLALRAELL